MAVNRCKNLFQLIRMQYLLPSNSVKCLIISHSLKSPYSVDVKRLDNNNIIVNDPISTDTPVAGSAHNQKEEDDHKIYEENIRIKILQASLPFVHDFGWSKEALSAGAESLGYPGIVHGLFPRGGAELIQHFYVTCNQQLVEKLRIEADGGSIENEIARLEEKNNAAVVTTIKQSKDPKLMIAFAVETRLRMIEPYLSHWPQALAVMTLPPNVPTSLANLLTLVDDIWYYAGDRSVDFNWYTRRVALAGIYKMTELYMIQDGSQDHQATWMFLNRRLDEATQLHNLFINSESAAQFAKDIALSTFITARNMLGLNWNR